MSALAGGTYLKSLLYFTITTIIYYHYSRRLICSYPLCSPNEGHLVTSHLKYNRSDSNIVANVTNRSTPSPSISVTITSNKPKTKHQHEEQPQITMNVIDLPTECKQS